VSVRLVLAALNINRRDEKASREGPSTVVQSGRKGEVGREGESGERVGEKSQRFIGTTSSPSRRRIEETLVFRKARGWGVEGGKKRDIISHPRLT